jgi:hypothetical protein
MRQFQLITPACRCVGSPSLMAGVRDLAMCYRKFLHALLTIVPVVAGGAECLSYGTSGATVTGRLSRASYETLTAGDHPKRVSITRWMLDTPEPFCVDGDEKSGNIYMRGASSIELFARGDVALVPFIGKNVRAVGKLLPTHLPHYHAYLILEVQAIHEER